MTPPFVRPPCPPSLKPANIEQTSAASKRPWPAYLLVVLLYLFPSQNHADTLAGSVKDLDSQTPLPGINVLVSGHDLGAATDQQGHFVIDGLSAGSYTLLVSAIGYENQYLKASLPQSTALQINLKETFFQMQSVVVTGTRSEKIHLNSPVATEVITAHEIQNSGASDLGELMEQRAGVSVSSSVEGGTIVNLLGMDSKYVLILVDGQPITGKFNNRSMLNQITTSNIEKVEIVKGPGSSLYGSEAMGGVINIITKSGQQAPLFTASLRYSDRLNTFNPLDKQTGKRNILLDYNHQGKSLSTDFNADIRLANTDKSIQHIDVNDFQTYSVSNRTKFEPLQGHDLTFDGAYYQSNEDGSATLLISNTLTKRVSGNLKYNWKPADGFKLTLNARSSHYIRDYQQSRPWGELLKNETTGEDQQELEIMGNLIRPWFTLDLGSEFSLNDYASSRLSGGTRTVQEQAIYTQIETTPLQPWTIVAGMRWDNSSDFSSVLNPRLALLYKPSQRWRLRFSAGSGYRKPSFMDRYIDWNHQQFGYRVVGNPELRPERSVGLTAGVDYYHPTRYQASIFLYANQFSDMIVDSLLTPGIFTYVNIEKVNYSGLELRVRWSVNKRWLASWSYTYALNRYTQTGEVVPNTPIHSGTIKLSYKHPHRSWGTSLKLKAVGSYTVDEFIVLTQQLQLSRRDAYLMVDLDSHYNLKPWLKFSGGIKNLLNETDATYGPFFGRTLYLELQTSLKGN